MVEKVEHNMSEKMAISFFQELDHGKSLEACFVSMFRFVRKHRKFYQLYFDNAQRSNVIGISWEILRYRKESLSYNQFGYKNEEEMIYHEAFFIHGLSAMLRRWVKRDCPETPKEMYDCLKKQFTPWLE